MKNKFKAVIFDFDYTLVDSSKAICSCFNYALEKFGIPSLPDERICRTIGLPIPEMLVRLAGEKYREKSGEFRSCYREIANEVMDGLTFIYEEADITVKKLKEAGIKLGIVSTKSRNRIEGFLRLKGLLDFFDIVYGAEDVKNLKPDPEGLLDAVLKLEYSLSDCLYVGDSITDAMTAQRAGVPFAAVLSGSTVREEFGDHDVLWFMENLAELPELMEIY